MGFLISLAITLVFYMIIPTIIRIIVRKPITSKYSTLISFLNSFILWCSLVLLYQSLNYSGTPNVTPAVLYFLINRGVLSYGSKEAHIEKQKKIKSFRLTK